MKNILTSYKLLFSCHGLAAYKSFLVCSIWILSMYACSVVPDSLWPPWAVAHQTPLSIGFFQARYWSGLPFPPLGGLPDPGIKPVSPALAPGSFTAAPPKANQFLRTLKLSDIKNKQIKQILFIKTQDGKAFKKTWNCLLVQHCPNILITSGPFS